MPKINLDKKVDFRQVHDWVDQLERYGWQASIETDDDDPHSKEIELVTKSNTYLISIRNASRKKDTYLGCIATCNKTDRGNDLSDGFLTKQTWYDILTDIVAYELGST